MIMKTIAIQQISILFLQIQALNAFGMGLKLNIEQETINDSIDKTIIIYAHIWLTKIIDWIENLLGVLKHSALVCGLHVYIIDKDWKSTKLKQLSIS